MADTSIISKILNFFHITTPPPVTPTTISRGTNTDPEDVDPLCRFNTRMLSELRFPRMALIGKTSTGKSEAVKSICFELQDQFSDVFVHSTSEPTQKFYSQFIPEQCIVSDNSLQALREKYEAHKERKKQWDARIADGTVTLEEAQSKCSLLIILDNLNCFGDGVWKNPLIQEIWMNGRHSWITIIVTLQNSQGIGPMLRDQMDWVMAWHDHSISGQKKLFQNWIGFFGSFADFKKTYNQVTGMYCCMVVRKYSMGRTDVDSNVFQWKPQLVQDFIFSLKQTSL